MFPKNTQIEAACKELDRSLQILEKRRRRTVLVRVQKKWRDHLKPIAKKKKITLSRLHDEIYKVYLKNPTGEGYK